MGVSADPGRIIGGILALFFGSCIASSAGIGGGGVNVPILLFMLGKLAGGGSVAVAVGVSDM